MDCQESHVKRPVKIMDEIGIPIKNSISACSPEILHLQHS